MFSKSIFKNYSLLNLSMRASSKKTKIKILYEEDETTENNISNRSGSHNPTKLSKIELLKRYQNENKKTESIYPKNFEKHWSILINMRATLEAPVDTMGADCCPDQEAPRNIYKFQTLVSLLLSSQTKDPQTYAAMKRLIKHGLDIDTIIATEDEKITELIWGVSFHNNKTKFIKKVFIKYFYIDGSNS
jgi:endonuclease-3